MGQVDGVQPDETICAIFCDAVMTLYAGNKVSLTSLLEPADMTWVCVIFAGLEGTCIVVDNMLSYIGSLDIEHIHEIINCSITARRAVINLVVNRRAPVVWTRISRIHQSRPIYRYSLVRLLGDSLPEGWRCGIDKPLDAYTVEATGRQDGVDVMRDFEHYAEVAVGNTTFVGVGFNVMEDDYGASTSNRRLTREDLRQEEGGSYEVKWQLAEAKASRPTKGGIQGLIEERPTSARMDPG